MLDGQSNAEQKHNAGGYQYTLLQIYCRAIPAQTDRDQ